MVQPTNTFGSFSVRDLDEAQRFYTDTLGLKVEGEADPAGGHVIWILGPGEQRVMVYAKPDHSPAGFTVFNLEVDDVEEAVTELTGRGASFEHYEQMGADERGIVRQGGVAGAWLTDPSGNVVAVLQRTG